MPDVICVDRHQGALLDRYQTCVADRAVVYHLSQGMCPQREINPVVAVSGDFAYHRLVCVVLILGFQAVKLCYFLQIAPYPGLYTYAYRALFGVGCHVAPAQIFRAEATAEKILGHAGHQERLVAV